MRDILLTGLADTLAFAHKIPDEHAGYRQFIIHHAWGLMNKLNRR